MSQGGQVKSWNRGQPEGSKPQTVQERHKQRERIEVKIYV